MTTSPAAIGNWEKKIGIAHALDTRPGPPLGPSWHSPRRRRGGPAWIRRLRRLREAGERGRLGSGAPCHLRIVREVGPHPMVAQEGALLSYLFI